MKVGLENRTQLKEVSVGEKDKKKDLLPSPQSTVLCSPAGNKVPQCVLHIHLSSCGCSPT